LGRGQAAQSRNFPNTNQARPRWIEYTNLGINFDDYYFLLSALDATGGGALGFALVKVVIVPLAPFPTC